MMQGVTVERVGEVYKLEFESYDKVLEYLYRNKPAQFTFCYDGEKYTGSKPVATPRVVK